MDRPASSRCCDVWQHIHCVCLSLAGSPLRPESPLAQVAAQSANTSLPYILHPPLPSLVGAAAPASQGQMSVPLIINPELMQGSAIPIMSPPQVSWYRAAPYPSCHRHRWAHLEQRHTYHFTATGELMQGIERRKQLVFSTERHIPFPWYTCTCIILLVLACTHTNCYGTLYLLRQPELQVTVVIEIEHVFSVDWYCCCRRRHQTSTPYRHCQGNINNSRWSRTIDSTVPSSWNCSSCHHCGHEAIADVSTAVIKLQQLSARSSWN